MSKQPIKAEVFFQAPGDISETRLTVNGQRSELLKDSGKLQDILTLLGLPEGASARVLFTTDDVVVR
jgi:hypothetical protein